MEKRECLYTVGRIVNWCNHYGKQYGDSSKKLRIKVPYDPSIPLLGIYPKSMKMLTQKDIYSSLRSFHHYLQ